MKRDQFRNENNKNNMREKKIIKDIKKAIIDYNNSEFSQDNAYEDFDDLFPDPEHIGLAYTETPNGEHSIQYEINILDNTRSQYVDNTLIKHESFLDQNDLLDSLKFGSFDEYVHVEEKDLYESLGLSIDEDGEFYKENELEANKENNKKKHETKFNPHIKIWNNKIHNYERINYFSKEKEQMFRIRFPKESKYSEYSLDTSIVPKRNQDNKTSYITVDKDFEYKIIAPGKTKEGKLDWTKSNSLKVTGYELKEEFSKDQTLNKRYEKNKDINKNRSVENKSKKDHSR